MGNPESQLIADRQFDKLKETEKEIRKMMMSGVTASATKT